MRRLAVRSGYSAALALVLLGLPSPAAAEATAADKAAAQVLFDDGRKLMSEGRYPDACPKLAESQRLDPGMGTEFNLSDCLEHIGQTASAWTGFLDVAAAARAAHQTEREQVARERAAALESKLSRLLIVVPADQSAGLAVTRDGEPVNHVLWGTAVPIDPGSHTIAASAPGKEKWETTLRIDPGQPQAIVNVPALKDAAPVAVALVPLAASVETNHVEPPAAGRSTWSTQRTVSVIVGGTGVVGVGIGSFFAMRATSKKSASFDDCSVTDRNKCDAIGVSLREDALNAGNIATVAFVAGGALMAASAVIWFWPAPHDGQAPKSARLKAAPNLDPHLPGLVVRGAW